MTPLPSLLILADRDRLVVYRPADAGRLECLDSLEPIDDETDLSELIDDQAETFPTDDPGTPGYDSMPFTDELEIRSLRQIAGTIEEILEREQPATWGFAADGGLNQALLEQLPDLSLQTLSVNLTLDLTDAPPAEVRARFAESFSPSPPS